MDNKLLVSLKIKKLEIIKEKILVKDSQINIEKGKIYIIKGENGSGKSTLMKLFFSDYNEDVYFDGELFFNNSVSQKDFAFVPQDFKGSFDSLIRLEYYFKQFDFEIIEKLMNYLELPDTKTILKKKPFELSGGMLQRLLIIRSLLNQKMIIFMDEPFSALNYSLINKIYKLLLQEIEDGKTIVLTNHIPNVFSEEEWIKVIIEDQRLKIK